MERDADVHHQGQLASDRCEVLFTFMSDQVNRFVTVPEEAERYAQLFGTEDYSEAGDLKGDDRKLFLRDLYVRQLREMAGFTFAKPFEFRDLDRGTRTMYFLMFGTNHIRGLDLMKKAMWKLDPERGVLFAGLTGGDPFLFEPKPDLARLEAAIRGRFVGETVGIEDIERFVITETDFTSTHYKRPVLEASRSEVFLRVSQSGRAAIPTRHVRCFTSAGLPVPRRTHNSRSVTSRRAFEQAVKVLLVERR